jgi:hypothetical protein
MRYTIASRRTPTLLPRLAMPGRARFPPRCPIEEHTESFIVMHANDGRSAISIFTTNRSAARRQRCWCAGAQSSPFWCMIFVRIIIFSRPSSVSVFAIGQEPRKNAWTSLGPMRLLVTSKGYRVRHEVPVGIKTNKQGDRQRVHFQFAKGKHTVALEVKWWDPEGSRDVTHDVTKLKATKSKDRFLIILGPGETLAKCKAKSDRTPLLWGGKLVRWKSGKTDYAARWIKV